MAHTPAPTTDVVFVDGVRTPFGKARPDGLYAHTRADDLAVKLIRDLLRRHPTLDPALIEDVAIAATTQQGDQGLTLGRTAALLAGLPTPSPATQSTACAPARSPQSQQPHQPSKPALLTLPSQVESNTWAATPWDSTPTRTPDSSAKKSCPHKPSTWDTLQKTSTTDSPTSPKNAATPTP